MIVPTRSCAGKREPPREPPPVRSQAQARRKVRQNTEGQRGVERDRGGGLEARENTEGGRGTVKEGLACHAPPVHAERSIFIIG